MIAYLILKHAKIVSPMGALLKQVLIRFSQANEFGKKKAEAGQTMLWRLYNVEEVGFGDGRHRVDCKT